MTVHSTTKLHEFISQFDHAVDDSFEDQKQVDFESNHKSLQLICGSPLKKYSAKIYTNELFGKFQKQPNKVMCLKVVMK